jgi:hypothetical protein
MHGTTVKIKKIHYNGRENRRTELCSGTKGSMCELNYQHKIKPKSVVYSSVNKIEAFQAFF